MLVATSDERNKLVKTSVRDMLKILRERLNRDVFTVAEFVDGPRVFPEANCRLPAFPFGGKPGESPRRVLEPAFSRRAAA